LKTAKRLHADGTSFVFPNDLTPGKPLSENALSYMLRRIGVPTTVHGFRSSFRDWAAENTDANFAVMELSLAHDVGSGVVQSYARSDLLDRGGC
jgi:integrase